MNKNRIFRSLLFLTAVIAATGAAAESRGHDVIEEIVVTATKREASAQKVPVSIAAIGEQRLTDLGIDAVTDLSNVVAGLDMNNQGPGESSIAIRGISEMTDDFFITPTVGLYVDEVPLVAHPTRSPELGLFDAARVEVLRGPQGTLFGDGSLGGTIRVISNKPDSTAFYGSVGARYSSWDGGDDNQSANGFINIPISEDKLALRVTATWQDNGGYIDNGLAGTLVRDIKDMNHSDFSTVRAALRATPTDTLTLDLVYNHSDLDVNDIAEEESPRIKNRNILEPNTNEMDMWSATINWDLGWATLVSATGYTEIDQTNSYEITDFVVPLVPTLQFFLPPLAGTTVQAANFDFDTQQETFTQEIRLVSNVDEPLQWTVGAFFRNDKRHLFEDIFTFPDDLGTALGAPALDFTFDQEFDQLAFFGELDYEMGNFNVILGARYYEEDKESVSATNGWITFAPPETNRGEDDGDVFIPKVVVSYTPSDTFTGYVSYTKGFRAGGVNPLADAAAALGATLPSGFDPENLEAMEVGIKKIWNEGRIRSNIYLYQNDWQDMIQQVVDPPTNFSYKANVGKATSTGLEVELEVLLTERLSLAMAASYIDAEFDNDVIDPGTGAQLLASGNRIPGIPELSYNVSLDYRQPIGQFQGHFRLDYSFRGDVYSEVSNLPITKTDDLTILNIRAGISSNNWDLHLFSNNVTNEDGAVIAFTPLTPSINTVEGTFVRPRETGIELRYRF